MADFKRIAICLSILGAFTSFPLISNAQDSLPQDNGLEDYHTSPRWRESESHPLRVLAYVFHPIGWLAREVVFRPLSYFASSTPVHRSVMGYREPFDYRSPECFSADEAVPDCRSVRPFNYDRGNSGNRPSAVNEDSSSSQEAAGKLLSKGTNEVFFPSVSFDFDQRTLNESGKEKARQVAELLNSDSSKSMNVIIEGHTDYKGSKAYNDKLGLARAQSVNDELVANGISSERLSALSFGETKPVSEEKTAEARALNRRVELRLEDTK